MTELYISPNGATLSGIKLDPDWGWEITMTFYDDVADETVIDMIVGYENQTHEHSVIRPGDVRQSAANSVMELTDFINSTGPIGAGGWPPPPSA